MMDIALRNHDLCIINGDLALCSDDRSALGQALSMRLKTIAGEWFADTIIGIPYLTEIFGQRRSERFIRHLIAPVIESVPGITKVVDFAIEINGRHLGISFVASLSDGSQVTIAEKMEVR